MPYAKRYRRKITKRRTFKRRPFKRSFKRFKRRVFRSRIPRPVKLPFQSKYPQLRRNGTVLTLKWGDRRVLQKVDNELLAGNMYKLVNMFSALSYIEDPVGETAPCFLLPPEFCSNEVGGIIDRYRYWRIKSVKLYLTNFTITTTQYAQASSDTFNKTKIGILYHYGNAPAPTWGQDNPYIRWHTLPLKKPIKCRYNAHQKGWFDSLIRNGAATTVAGGVTTRSYSQLAADVAVAWRARSWELAGGFDATDPTKQNFSAIAALDASRIAFENNTIYLPTTINNPDIKNFKMPQMYWAIMPDFKVDPAQKYNYQFTWYQYVTLQFKDNTELWSTKANTATLFSQLRQESQTPLI